MAGGNGVWGIDIGQCGLKALRGVLASDGETVVADSFDFIEYPKILSQPDAEPDKLIREAIKQFLSRNSIRGDKVAISVPGQSGLARFIKLPPVEAKKIPDIVKYEAKQQIPFDLQDVVWDFQPMPGSEGGEDEGFALDTEVGLFAMKRDQVFKTIAPLVDAEVELDVIQLAPIAIYNAVAFDLADQFQPLGEAGDQPPESIVVLSMGTDTSDLVITNGYRVWQRSIPLGGNHFTKQITKELKFTFAAAEVAKRDARQRDDAKQIFQSMRSAFNDLVTEVNRSLGYYRSLDRSVKLKKMVVLGNTIKLPGLMQYLGKNLDMEVSSLDVFRKVTGAEVTESQTFKDNILSFPVCYGLVLQGLGASKLRTNLVPREILTQRLIRRKKPWVAAIAAALLMSCAVNYFFHFSAYDQVQEGATKNGVSWTAAASKVSSLTTESGGLESEDTSQTELLARLNELGNATVGVTDGRSLWLELLKAITESLPRNPDFPADTIPTQEEQAFNDRPEIYIDAIESEFFSDLTTWFSEPVQQKYLRGKRAFEAAERDARLAAAENDPDAEGAAEEGAEEPGGAPDDTAVGGEGGEGEEMLEGELPTVEGAGWVIEIRGHHFQYKPPEILGSEYVRTTLLSQLDHGKVQLPSGPGGELMEFDVQELGVLAPVMVEGKTDFNYKILNPDFDDPEADNGGMGGGMEEGGFGRGGGGFSGGFGTTRTPAEEEKEDPDNPHYWNPPRYTFKVQFCWKQIPLRARLENRKKPAEGSEDGDSAATGEGF